MTSDDTTRYATRRRVLQATGLATGATLTGCVAGLPPLGQRVRYGRVDVPEGSEPTYAEWLPEPSALESVTGEESPTSVIYTKPGQLGSATFGTPFRLGTSLIKPKIDYLGVEFDSLEWAVSVFGRNVVLHGDIDRRRVRETLIDTVYEPVEEFRTFELYRRTDDRERVVAVSGTHIVVANGPDAPADARTIVATGAGDRPRYTDTDPVAARLIAAAGDRPFVWIGHGGLDPGREPGNETESDSRPELEPVDGAFSYTFDDSAAYFVEHTLYPEGGVPSRGAVRRQVERRDRPRISNAVDIERDGRLYTVEMRIDAETFREQDSKPPLPVVTWQTTAQPDGDGVVVRHVAGESIDASRLVLRDDGEVIRRLGADRETLGPGDTFTVDRPADASGGVLLTYETGDHSWVALLGVEFGDSADGKDADAAPTPTDRDGET